MSNNKKLWIVVSILLLAFPTFSQTFFAAREKGKFGFIDLKGEWVIKPWFDDAFPFSNGFARVKKGDLWSFVDKTGRMIAPLRFGGVYNFEDGIARVKLPPDMNGTILFGLIDSTGTWVVQPTFHHIRKFSDNGLAMAKNQKGDWGFINKKGEWVIQPQYSGLRDFFDGRAMAKSKGSWGYIDETGAWVIPAKYNHESKFSEGYAAVEVKGGWMYLDKQGLPLSVLKFDIAKPFSDGVGVVHKKDWAIIDKQGKLLSLPVTALYPFHDGLARARKKDLWGFINKKGEWVVTPTFTALYDFNGKLAQAKDGLLWGYINKEGLWVSAHYQNAERFINGYAIFREDGKWGVIGEDGKVVVTPAFEKLRSLLDEDTEDEDAEVD